MRKIIKKTSIVLIIALFLISGSFYDGKLLYDDVCYGSSFSVSAEETADANSVVSSDDELQTGSVQPEDTANAETNAGDADNRGSGSSFFKWAIPITCILSLALAIFLAIRKANKIYGKDWE